MLIDQLFLSNEAAIRSGTIPERRLYDKFVKYKEFCLIGVTHQFGSPLLAGMHSSLFVDTADGPSAARPAYYKDIHYPHPVYARRAECIL